MTDYWYTDPDRSVYRQYQTEFNMKRYFRLLLATVLLLQAALSCKESGPDETAGILSVTPETIVFGPEGGKEYIEVRTSAGSWSLELSDDSGWCVPEKTSGTTSSTFSVTAEPAAEEDRTAVITFSAPGCESVEVTVTQEGAGPAFEGTPVVPAPEEWDGTRRADISYQALVYSFADSDDADRVGDFEGLRSRLDYLDALGVSAIWLSPVHPSSSYHGYDVMDYAAVNPTFGSESDLQSLIDDAHSRGIKIYLDYVLNHTSFEHPWFISASSSEDSPYREFYALSKDPATDIAQGRIAQIATEGAAGYDPGQWFPTTSDAGASGRFSFILDWSDPSAPTVTVTETSEAADPENTDTSDGGKYLYYGDGQCLRFYEVSEDSYSLTVDFDSDWGFLIRTSPDSWDAGTKYGAPNASTILTMGEPFRLYVNSASLDPANIQFSLPLMYHSHFWTSWFADLNYGAATEAEQSGAFKAVTEAADKWVQMGVDGFRLDAVKHIYHNQNSDENPVFLQKFYERMDRSYKAAGGQGEFYMVGEMLDEADKVAPYYKGLPAFFEFSFWYRLKWALQNGIGCYFANDILGYQDLYRQYRQDYIEATKLSNHDEDRAGSDLGQDTDKMKMAAAVLLTAQGDPYIYQGEELGYWGTKANGDEYVRTPVMWDSDRSSLADGSLSGKVDYSMLTSGISVESQQADSLSILNVYRTFAQLRNTYPALAQGTMVRHPVYNETSSQAQQIAAWYMEYEGQRMLVIHNFGEEPFLLTLTDDLSKPVGLLGEAETGAAEDGTALMLGGLSSVVFDLE